MNTQCPLAAHIARQETLLGRKKAGKGKLGTLTNIAHLIMKNIILIFWITFCSCITFTSKKTNPESSITNNKIIGRWCSKSKTADYPHLTFREDGYVIFDCKIDTVFGLKYSLHNNYLIVNPTGKPINRNKVLKLTQDSLVLETLLSFQTKQVYYRCDKLQ